MFLAQLCCAFSKKLCLHGWDVDIFRRLFICCVILDEISNNVIKAVQNIQSCAPECHNIDSRLCGKQHLLLVDPEQTQSL